MSSVDFTDLYNQFIEHLQDNKSFDQTLEAVNIPKWLRSSFFRDMPIDYWFEIVKITKKFDLHYYSPFHHLVRMSLNKNSIIDFLKYNPDVAILYMRESGWKMLKKITPRIVEIEILLI